jgi:tRNA uridine 5-carbamoylmethylation protein Kti12
LKKLVLITGAPGVGKTTVCKELFSMIDGCAWLDSDWCYMVNPWHSKTKEQQKYIEDTYGRILRSYFTDTATSTIIFSWVMHSPFMFDIIINQLDGMEFKLYKIALICDMKSHIYRKTKDGRRTEQIENQDSMEPYFNLGATIVDVSTISAKDAAYQIVELLNENTNAYDEHTL